MGDQAGKSTRVRRVRPPDQPATNHKPQASDGGVEAYARHSPSSASTIARRAPAPPPAGTLSQYIIGGVVSASVLLALILVWMIATGGSPANNPSTGANTRVGGDVPTIQLPVSGGTLVPSEFPTSNLVVPPAQPSFGSR